MNFFEWQVSNHYGGIYFFLVLFDNVDVYNTWNPLQLIKQQNFEDY